MVICEAVSGKRSPPPENPGGFFDGAHSGSPKGLLLKVLISSRSPDMTIGVIHRDSK